jgi:hypothetical protein
MVRDTSTTELGIGLTPKLMKELKMMNQRMTQMHLLLLRTSNEKLQSS